MKDTLVVALLLVGFASLVTTHVAIAIGLLRRAPRWRGLVAFAIAPMAPYWAWRERMRVRLALWVGAAIVYVLALVLASF